MGLTHKLSTINSSYYILLMQFFYNTVLLERIIHHCYQNVSQDNKNIELFNQAYGIGSQVGVMMPFSRSNETEADSIGLTLMAVAGYNPDQAAELWKRMNAQSGGQAPPEFLSTHPSNESRIANLSALAPKAKEEAKKFGVTSFRKN